MDDAQAAKLRALAERAPQDTFMAVDNCVYSLTRDGERNRIWMDIYVHRKHGEVREGTDLAAYIAAASPDVVTALIDERDAAMAKIAAHNAECESLCERDTKGGRCEAYVSRGRECTDCPRNWMIDDSRVLLGGGGRE